MIEEHERFKQEKPSFWKQEENLRVLMAIIFLAAAWTTGNMEIDQGFIPVLLYGISILTGGYKLLLQGLKNLAAFQFDMRTLMTVAVIGAAAIGEWGEAAVVVILFAVSEALESYSMDKARESIQSLLDIAPKQALIRRDGQEISVSVEDIQVKDLMLVKPGQKLAMDGIVVKGSSTVNQAAITGESVPAYKEKGSTVYAGTMNEDGYIEVEVTKRAEDTTLAKIIHLVEEAQAERAPSQAFIDKFAAWYTPVIILFALILAIVPPLFLGDWHDWLYRGLAVLVVGCPCALIVSTPVSIVTAIGHAAKHGVLIKGGVYLEKAGALSVIAFDKTGTLTKGVPEVTDIVPLSEHTEKEILLIAAALEKNSGHPLAAAVTRKADKDFLEYRRLPVEGFYSMTGRGVKASVKETEYYLGSPNLFSGMMHLSSNLSDQILTMQRKGKTVLVLGTSKEVLGLLAVADSIRESSKASIGKLQASHIKTVMVTGDNSETARAIAEQLGIDDVQAEQMPEEKLEYIKQLQMKQDVAMVGDGINDAPALAASSVGIAMGGAGTDTALETADIALMADDLEKLPFTMRLSRNTLRIIKQNISFALLIKIVALLLVIPGWLTLWMAIFADMGATLIVTLNGLRLLRVKE
ncbi:Cd2+/Zn2+-exporting ATPase [Sediminibacillus halophilus]|uniref:Cd(2+)-exporting ATPase n=1 Tax=Sediminibacillus halophilus TaxID=482461 RepID=A0A1G9VXQ8_9BACI|nr:Cd2+/Zn2+-exporting ATPase [Sediminibacillus halophilus]